MAECKQDESVLLNHHFYSQKRFLTPWRRFPTEEVGDFFRRQCRRQWRSAAVGWGNDDGCSYIIFPSRRDGGAMMMGRIVGGVEMELCAKFCRLRHVGLGVGEGLS